MSWKEGDKVLQYYENTKNLPPRALTVKASDLVTIRPARALDLGCGACIDAIYLIGRGFSTVAMDVNPDIQRYAPVNAGESLQFIICPIEELLLPSSSFDLVTSQYTLPFLRKSDTEQLIGRIRRGLKPGGVFAANLFGKDDAWNKPGNNGDISFHDKSEVERVLTEAGFNIRLFEEKYSNEPTATGKPKECWHIFEFIAQV